MGKKGTGTPYCIVVRSEITDRCAEAFESMEIETKGGRTILTGEIVDQAHLYGILNHIARLRLQLVSVHALPEHTHLSADRASALKS